MRHKKWFGMPVGVVAGIIAAVTAVSVFAGVMLTQEIPSKVSIVVAYGLSAWENEACTIELVELDFGKVMANEQTDPFTFYLKNEGETPSYIAISQTGLAGKHLILNWQGAIGDTPPDDYLVFWTEIDSGRTVKQNLEVIDGEIYVLPDNAVFQAGQIIRINDEWLLINSLSSGGIMVTRGYMGTTPVAISAGAVIYFEEQDPLASEASMPITLLLEADPDASKMDVNFTTIVNASDIPY